MEISFEQYQNKYGYYHIPSFPEKCFNKLRTTMHQVIQNAIEAVKLPNLVMKVMSVVVRTLEYISHLTSNLSWAKLLLKDIKVLTNFIIGLRSVDGLLNLKFSWKIIVLNISGFVLFVLSSITLAEKFLIDCSAIKTALAGIPIFGVLPFGGLLPIAFIGLLGSLLLLSLERREKLKKTAEKIKEKIAFWEEPLNVNKIKDRQIKYDGKISDLEKTISLKEQQLIDGRQAEKGIPQNEKKLLKIHQKALEKLIDEATKEKAGLKALNKKKNQWEYLGTHLDKISPENLQSFQIAKKEKWEKKLKRIEKDDNANSLSMVNNVIGIFQQSINIITGIAGRTFTIMPLVLLVLGLASAGISVTNYFLNKSVKEMKISPVKMKNYIELDER